jgi:hypothetical protein
MIAPEALPTLKNKHLFSSFSLRSPNTYRVLILSIFGTMMSMV